MTDEQFDIQYTPRVIEAHELYSPQMGEERTIKVYLPPNYDALKKYPVLYCHDGNEFFTHGRIATIANQMIYEGRLRSLIIVGIAVNHKFRTDDYAPNGARHQQYSEFVLDTCLPFVESTYLVDSSNRFMAGISLGAAVTMALYLRVPRLLPRLLLFSGAYYSTVQKNAKMREDFTNLETYMVVGRQETAVDTQAGPYDFYSLNQEMRDLLQSRGARVEYVEADGTHIWGFWQKQLPAALEWLNEACR